MTRESEALWRRALESFGAAGRELPFSPNVAAGRAYYAAFYAVSAHFALSGVLFNSHEAVEISFHKELVKPGLVPKEFSELWKGLKKARQIGDYGVFDDVSASGARTNLDSARTIIEAVFRLHPGTFSRPSWMETEHPEP